MGLMEGDYPTNESRVVFQEKLLRELRANSAIESVAFTNRFQMVFSGNGPIEIEGKQYKDDKDRPVANFENVTDGYFCHAGARNCSRRAAILRWRITTSSCPSRS